MLGVSREQERIHAGQGTAGKQGGETGDQLMVLPLK
jgi:hypothetical protein